MRSHRRRPCSLAILGCLAVALSSVVARADDAETLLAVPAAGTIDQGAYRVRCDLTGQGAWPDGGRVTIALDRRADGSGQLLTVDRGGARLLQLEAGRVTRELQAEEFRPASVGTLIVKRDLRRTVVVYAGTTILRAYGGRPTGGEVGALVEGGLEAGEPLVQPFGEVILEADFATPNPIPTGWQVDQGSFVTTGVKGPAPRPDLAANPFAYGLKDPAESVTTAGHWFWDGYSLQVSAKPGSNGAIGLVAYSQDPRNYIVFRWLREMGGRECQLALVRDGQWRYLARGDGGYLPGQWYRLGLRADDGYIEVVVDGRVVLSARTDAFGCGRVGLFAANDDAAVFDDVRVLAWSCAPGAVSLGEAIDPAQGRWEADEDSLRVSGSAAGAVAALGDPDWRDSEALARVRGADRGMVGLCLGYRDAANLHAFRAKPGDGSVEIVRIRDGAEEVLARGTGAAGGAVDLSFRREGALLIGAVGETVACVCAATDIEKGRAGLYASGADGAVFENVGARALEAPLPSPSLTAQFTREATMAGWASPAGLWSQPIGDPPTVWFEGNVFGDGALSLHIANATSQTGTVTLVLGGSPEVANSGTSATFTFAAAAGIGARIDGPGGAAEVAQAPWADDDPGHELRVERARGLILACVDDQCLLSTPAGAAQGSRVGVRSNGVPLDFGEAEVSSPGMVEYTFARAPADWYVGRGVWEVSDRWKCSPGWAWMCGYQDDAPTLWSKRSFSGDQVVEVYCAMRMDNDGDPHYIRPSDLNITICGDGARRDSGYSLVFGGWNPGQGRWNEARTALLRGTQVVAEDANVKFDVGGGNDSWHRHWFHLRVAKVGGRVVVDIDGRRVFDYQDPDPLAGGHVAFWTYKNGFLVARARLSAESAGELEPIPQRPADDSTDIPFSLYGAG